MEQIKERILTQDQLVNWLSNSCSFLKDRLAEIKYRFKCLQKENLNLISRLEQMSDYEEMVKYIQAMENVLQDAGLMQQVDRITKPTNYVKIDKYNQVKSDRDYWIEKYMKEKAKNESYEKNTG